MHVGAKSPYSIDVWEDSISAQSYNEIDKIQNLNSTSSFMGCEHDPMLDNASRNWKKVRTLCPLKSLQVHIESKDNAFKSSPQRRVEYLMLTREYQQKHISLIQLYQRYLQMFKDDMWKSIEMSISRKEKGPENRSPCFIEPHWSPANKM